MSEFVRVRLDSGVEASVSPEFAELHKLTILDKPATSNGAALDPKYNPLKPPAKADNTTTKEK